jgi:DNA-binding transcriptional regulator YiaG
MPKEKTIDQRIKDARKKLELSQSQAAKSWGFSINTLQAWENRKNQPRGLYREKLVRILAKAGV